MGASFLFLAYLVKAGQVALTLRWPLVCPVDTNARWTEIGYQRKVQASSCPLGHLPVPKAVPGTGWLSPISLP